jgi:eukaryotic-like serine/threonine-protein kinase
MIGSVVSHYRVLENLGRGGMGVVYKAEDTKLGRPVALKFLADDLAANPSALERFRKEAQAASALNHPNICTIYDIDEFEGRPFIAMEFLQGKTLKDLLREGPLQTELLLEFSTQLANALGAAHSANILHRDLKPANIFVTERRQTKILDFGLAKLLSNKKDGSRSDPPDGTTTAAGIDHLTNPGAAIGTIAYMSPEQARGESLDERSDLFSLGSVLYEMTTGSTAFAGDTSAITFDAILNRAPVSARERNPNVPPGVEEILVKLLQKDRNRRYQSAVELESDLLALRRDPNRRRPLKIAIPVALVGVATILLAWLFFSNRAPALTDRDVIVLAEFVNETGDSVFDGTLKQALAIQLEQSPHLNIFPDDRVRETLQLMARSPDEKVTDPIAREVCQREGLKAVIGGSIVGLGTSYVLTLTAVNCTTGESLAREQQQAASKEQVLTTMATAASSLRSKLGESLPSIKSTEVPTENKVTTTSLQALKAYNDAMDLNSRGNYRDAIALLDNAVKLDPNFVAAYSSMRVVYSNLGDGDKSRQYATKAYELRDKTSERERLRVTASYQANVLRNLDKAVETYSLYARMYPKDYISWNGLAVTHRDLGRMDQAVKEFEEVLRLRSLPLNLVNLAQGYIDNGQIGEAKATLTRALQDKPDYRSTHTLLYQIAFLEGDKQAMENELDWFKVPAKDRPPLNALSLYGRLSEMRKRGGDPGPRTEMLFGYGLKAENRAKESLRKNGFSQDRALSAAMAGDIEAVRALEEASRKSPEDTLLNFVFLPMAAAAFELRAGDARKAINMLKPVLRFEPSARTLQGIYIRGQAYLKLKAGPEAAEEFQKLIKHRNVAPTNELVTLSHLGLARAYALADDTSKARKSYEDFFANLKDGDADLPVLLEAKAEYQKLMN